MKIAVFVDPDGNTLSINEPGLVCLFSPENGVWQCKKKFSFELPATPAIQEIRNRMQSLVNELEGCKVFIAKYIKGVPYSILESMGFSIWKLTGSPVEFLDFVKEKEEAILSAKLKPKPAPIAVGDLRDGNYKIDLVKVLESDRMLTSKQVLIPFLQKAVFQELEITCEHLPRWFAQEFAALKVKLHSVETVDGFCRAVVVPQD